MLACLVILPGYRRRKVVARTILVLLLSLCGFATLSGCGNCTDLGTRPGRYSFTVTGTAQGGASPATQSQVISLTVTIP